MKQEGKLNELQGTSILTKEFINKLIRRIEAFEEVELTVCKDGTPTTIKVLTRPSN